MYGQGFGGYGQSQGFGGYGGQQGGFGGYGQQQGGFGGYGQQQGYAPQGFGGFGGQQGYAPQGFGGFGGGYGGFMPQQSFGGYGGFGGGFNPQQGYMRQAPMQYAQPAPLQQQQPQQPAWQQSSDWTGYQDKMKNLRSQLEQSDIYKQLQELGGQMSTYAQNQQAPQWSQDGRAQVQGGPGIGALMGYRKGGKV